MSARPHCLTAPHCCKRPQNLTHTHLYSLYWSLTLARRSAVKSSRLSMIHLQRGGNAVLSGQPRTVLAPGRLGTLAPQPTTSSPPPHL